MTSTFAFAQKRKSMKLPGSATEDEFHVAVAGLLDVCLIPPTYFTTFPAGYGKLGKATAGRLRAKGMKRGFPDIIIFDTHRVIANRTYTKVIGLELKVGGNSLSSAQRECHARLQTLGIKVYTIRSLNDVIRALADALIAYRNVHIPVGKTEVEPMVQHEQNLHIARPDSSGKSDQPTSTDVPGSGH